MSLADGAKAGLIGPDAASSWHSWQAGGSGHRSACLAIAGAGWGRADIRVEPPVLRTQTDAAVGIIMGPECQPIGSALVVVDISECAWVSEWHGCRSRGHRDRGRAGNRTNRDRSAAGGCDHGRWTLIPGGSRAGNTAAAETLFAIISVLKASGQQERDEYQARQRQPRLHGKPPKVSR